MTKIKLCGLTRPQDIDAANALMPDYIGFVFARQSRRYILPEEAKALRRRLNPGICAVGVFVRESPEVISEYLEDGIIDIAQLHGGESADYIEKLRTITEKPLIQAFRVAKREDLERASMSPADYVLLDNGAGGTGEAFDWTLLKDFERSCFLAGGLNADNVREAVRLLHPFAVDVSSGIETAGVKNKLKMRAFVEAVRSASES